jgi:hypothetical protein
MKRYKKNLIQKYDLDLYGGEKSPHRILHIILGFPFVRRFFYTLIDTIQMCHPVLTQWGQNKIQINFVSEF